MKKPLRLLFYCSLVLAVTASAFVLLHSGKEFEGEEEEGIPGVLRSMDLWSEMRTYPNKTMSKTAYYESFEQSRRMSIAESREFSTTTAPWTALAPKNFSGRVISLAFHPTNQNIMWCGAASGGLWKTTTGGTGAAGGINWTYVPTGFPVLGVMSIAVHPTDGNTLYIGTGEVYNNGAPGASPTAGGHIRTYRGSYGVGILKTTDGGANWTKVLDYAYDNLTGVADILIHPSSPNTVFAATTNGVLRTTNGGTSWDTVLNVPMAMDICFKPGDPNTLYAACGNFNTAGRGIYKTTNANAATPTFSAINSGLPAVISGKIALCISPANPSMVFASVGKDPNTSDAFGLYISTNEGGSWTQKMSASTAMGANSALGQGWYAHDVAVSPNSTDSIYWAEMELYRSANNGTSFTRETIWSQWNINFTTVGATSEGTASTYAHADVHRVIISPFKSNTIFLLTDGGIFKSTNAGDAFIGCNGGLQTAQIYPNMAVSMQDANFMIGGLQDNEGFVYEGNAGCRRIGSLGDGFHAAISARNDDTCFITSYYLNIRRSTNQAVSWAAVYSNGNPPTETACFNSPFVMSQNDPNVLYAGTHRIKKSTNRGATWANVGPILSHTDAAILYIAVAPSNVNVLYVSVAPGGGERSKLFKSTNGGTSFTEITGTLPDRYYSDIAIDAANPNRIAVTLSGFGTSHVYLSRDAGATWSNIGGGLPDMPTNTVMFDPNNRRTIYVGNDLGVYYANGAPAGSGALPVATALTWTAYSEGIEDAMIVSDLLVTNTGKMRLASFGRGLWERDLAPSSVLPFVFKDFNVNVVNDGNQLRWTISSQGNTDRYEVEYSNDAATFRKVATVTATGASGDITYHYLHPITNDMDGFYRIKIIDADGSYEYSTVQAVKARKLITKLTATPNSTTGLFKLKIPSDNKGALNMQVYDGAGKLVMLKRLDLNPGAQEVPVNISHLAAGTYQLVCEGYQVKYTTRIIKN
jgi:photosystem II stability/assembly factor-like uncharacterized protein